MPDPSKSDPFKKLSRREREILEIIHRLESATVTEIIDGMEKPPTRPAVRALLGVMERKRYISHTKSGREFVYQASVSKKAAANTLLEGLLNNFFGGSLKSALATHLDNPDTEYTETDLKELSDVINQARSKGQ
jgi:BlaI family transcriptional regulator, penicillinase repressor